MTNLLTILLHVLTSKATFQPIFTLKKTVHMLLKPLKLLKKEQFVLLHYRLLPAEGVTIYTQVMLR